MFFLNFDLKNMISNFSWKKAEIHQILKGGGGEGGSK